MVFGSIMFSHQPKFTPPKASLGKMHYSKQSHSVEDIPPAVNESRSYLRSIIDFAGDIIKSSNILNSLSVTLNPDNNIITPEFFANGSRHFDDQKRRWSDESLNYQNYFAFEEIPSKKEIDVIQELTNKVNKIAISNPGPEKVKKSIPKSRINKRKCNRSTFHLKKSKISQKKRRKLINRKQLLARDCTSLKDTNNVESKKDTKEVANVVITFNSSRSLSESSIESEDSFCIIFEEDAGECSNTNLNCFLRVDSDSESDDDFDFSDGVSSEDECFDYTGGQSSKETVPEHVATKVGGLKNMFYQNS